MSDYSMPNYYQPMDSFGKPVSDKIKEKMAENASQIKEVEAKVNQEVERVKNAGLPAEKVRKRGWMTVWDRVEYIVDPGYFFPLHILYNPKNNEEGTTGVVDGLARINGKWCVLAGFDNKVMAGAWIAGQAENQLRITDLAKRLNVPLVWLVNCSGVKLTEQQEVYADRRGKRDHLLPSCRAGDQRGAHPGRDLRHQSGRRGISGHQPHHPVRPQGRQHGRGRRRDRGRNVAQGRV